MPFRVFAAGEVLTAANVNDYLAEQAISTFAGTAARASAITSPNEGQFAYLEDSDSLTFYNGSAWVNAGSAIAGTALSSGTATSGQVLTANGSGAVTFSTPTQGLTLINTTSFSAVSSQSFNNVFSSTYTNYRVLFHATGASSNSAITMRMRASGTDASGSNYYRAGTFNYNNSATVSALNASGTSFALVDILSAAPNRTYLTIELSQPNNATETMCLFMSAAQNSTSSYAFQGMGLHDLTTAYDGFTLLFSATSSGVVSIYGYNK